MDAKKKYLLLTQSKHFCAAPWTNLYLDPNGDILTCCVGKSILGNIRTNPLEEILNSDVTREIKQKLISDQSHPNCINCDTFTAENPADSWQRGYYNNIGKKINVDYEDIHSFVLGAVDARWSNTCNFKCIYCDPFLSSSIEKELNITISNGNLGNDQILKFILANQNNIVEIYLAGGEPLLMKENRKFLEQYTNTDTRLRINTNLSNIHEKNSILDKIKKFKNILWTVSVDNTKSRYEYTRYGSNWDQFLINLQTIKDLGHKIKFNMVYFIGNAVTFYNDLELLKSLGTENGGISVIPVFGHHRISSRNLPNHLKIIAQKDLNNLLKSIVNDPSLCNNISNCLRELSKETNGLDYKIYFDNIDNKRGTNWKTIFPELI
jgi:radical SAM protein with 4Fe4S-binding SPASM domain